VTQPASAQAGNVPTFNAAPTKKKIVRSVPTRRVKKSSRIRMAGYRPAAASTRQKKRDTQRGARC